MKLFSAILALAVAALASADPLSVLSNAESASTPALRSVRRLEAKSCGGSGDIASNVQVALNPEHPTAGQQYSLTLSFDLSEEVSSGKVNYIASVNGINVMNESKDLCEDLANGGNKCPLAAGSNTLVSTGTMPNISGSIKSKAVWTNGAGVEVLCWAIKETF